MVSLVRLAPSKGTGGGPPLQADPRRGWRGIYRNQHALSGRRQQGSQTVPQNRKDLRREPTIFDKSVGAADIHGALLQADDHSPATVDGPMPNATGLGIAARGPDQ